MIPVSLQLQLQQRSVPTALPLTFPELLEILHTAKYTGPVTFHLIHGVPTAAELTPEPVKVSILRTAPLTGSKDLAHTSR